MPKFVLDDEDDPVEFALVAGDEPFRCVDDIPADRITKLQARIRAAQANDGERSDGEQINALVDFLRAAVVKEDRARFDRAVKGDSDRVIGLRRISKLGDLLLGYYSGNPEGPAEPGSPEPGPTSTPTTSRVVSLSKGTAEDSES